MSNIKLKPFEACSKFYKLSPDNVVEVNDCCFQSCYRYAGYGPPLEECLKNCQDGQDILTEVMGKSPCQYGRRFKAPPTHDQISLVGSLINQGISPEEATQQCISMAKSEDDADNCKIDALSYILGNTETMSYKTKSPNGGPRIRSTSTSVDKNYSKSYVNGFLLVFVLVMIILYYTFKKIIMTSY
jgi:hypothetical protein